MNTERKIGEIFESHGIKFQVVESNDGCKGCAMSNREGTSCDSLRYGGGICIGRTDHKLVKFVRVESL